MGNRVIVNSDGTRFVDQTSGLFRAQQWRRHVGRDSHGFVYAVLREQCPDRRAGSVRRRIRYRIQGALDREQIPELPRLGVGDGGWARAQQRRAVLRAGVHVGKPATTLPFASGVFAFNASTGAKQAYHASMPYGRMSANASRVYLIENLNTLVALSQTDLHVVWSATIAGPGEQAPVVANGSRDRRRRRPPSRRTTHPPVQRAGAPRHSAERLRIWYSTYQGGSCGNVQIPGRLPVAPRRSLRRSEAERSS